MSDPINEEGVEGLAARMLDNMRRGWNREPDGIALGTGQRGISAAIWSHDVDDVQEVWADSDPDRHIISIMRSSGYRAEFFKNEQHCFSKTIQACGVSLMHAGVRPRAVHRGCWDVMHLYLPSKQITQFAMEEGLIASADAIELIDPECVQDKSIARIGLEIAAEMSACAPLSRLRIDTLGIELAIKMLRDWSNVSQYSIIRVGTSTGLAPWQVRAAQNYLESNLAEAPGLAEIAALVGLSAFHFARAFKVSTGISPYRYLIQLRIMKARWFLEKSDFAISEISARVGYDDPSYFARLFRREVGVTPAAYRREWRR